MTYSLFLLNHNVVDADVPGVFPMKIIKVEIDVSKTVPVIFTLRFKKLICFL